MPNADAWLGEIDTCRLHLLLGTMGSGKTFSCLAFIHHHLQKGTFDHYYLICPSFRSEQHSSYKFLRTHPKQVTVCETWDSRFLDMIIARQEPLSEARFRAKTPEALAKAEAAHGKVCLFLDDITSDGNDISSDPAYIGIVTKCRHLRIHTMCCIHNLKGVMRPVIRGNAAWLTAGRIVNDAMMETVYKEFLANQPRWKDYKAYRAWAAANITYDSHNMLFVNNLDGAMVESKDLGFIARFVAAQPGLERQFWEFVRKAPLKPASGARPAPRRIAASAGGSGLTIPNLALRL